MAEPTLTELAEKVFQLAGSLSSALAAENQTTPGASQDGTLLSYPSDDAIQGPRMQLIDALNQLLHQAIGPGDYLSWQVFNVSLLRKPIDPKLANIWGFRHQGTHFAGEVDMACSSNTTSPS